LYKHLFNFYFLSYPCQFGRLREKLQCKRKVKFRSGAIGSAIRLSAKVLAAAGITTDSEVDIQANDGRVVIQLHEQTQEQALDKLLANEPNAADLLALVQASLTHAIDQTDKTTALCHTLIKKLDQRELS